MEVPDAKNFMPPPATLPESLTVGRSDVTVVELNPFSFYVYYDKKTMQQLDQEVQEFGNKLCTHEFAQEPQQWAMVFLDNRWFRAEVLAKYYDAHEECVQAEVSLVDSGRRRVVSIQKIFPMQPKILKLGSVQSVRVFPKNIVSRWTGLLNILFDEYPELQIKINFEKPHTPNRLRSPHLIGTFADVLVGYKEWLSLQELLLRWEAQSIRNENMLDMYKSNSRSQELSEDQSEEQNCLQRSHNVSTNHNFNRKPSEKVGYRSLEHTECSLGRFPVGKLDSEPGRVTYAVESSCDLTSGQFESPQENIDCRVARNEGSSEESEEDSGPEAAECVRNIACNRNNVGFPKYVVDEHSSNRTMEVNMTNTKKVPFQKVVHMCTNFRRGMCKNDDLCSFSHALSDNKPPITPGRSYTYDDFAEFNLPKEFYFQHLFGLCTHVEDTGKVYLVLPYGLNVVHEVLCNKPLELPLWNLIQKLPEVYESKRQKSMTTISDIGQLAVAWIEKNGSGPLGNVTQGWYRVKVLERHETGYEVFLVDHGASLNVGVRNLYTVDPMLFLIGQQALSCSIRATTPLAKTTDMAKAMYEALKMKILIFKAYDKDDCGNFSVDLFSQTNDDSIHYGEYFVEKQILQWTEA